MTNRQTGFVLQPHRQSDSVVFNANFNEVSDHEPADSTITSDFRPKGEKFGGNLFSLQINLSVCQSRACEQNLTRTVWVKGLMVAVSNNPPPPLFFPKPEMGTLNVGRPPSGRQKGSKTLRSW